MKFSRLLAVIVCVFTLAALLGCGDINLGDLGLSLEELPLIGKGDVGDFAAEVTVEATMAAIETYAVTTEPEETRQVVWQTQAPVETTAYYEEYYTPAETSAQRYYDGSCTHMHNQEAEELYRTYGGLLSKNEYSEKEEYLRTHRVVIASGGLNLREQPISGKVLTLIPEGEIIPVYDYSNEWAYVYYSGNYGWCSMEFLFEPFLSATGSSTLMAYATVIANNGIELVTDRHCYDDDTVSIKIPSATRINVYYISGDRAFVSYKNIYGYCSTEYLAF